MDDVPVRNIMSKPAYTVHANERLDKALFLFQRHNISILPVINTNGCCVGVITLKDLVDKQNELIAECQSRGCLVNEDAQPGDADIPMSFFGDIAVFDDMSEHFYSVREETPISECIRMLLEHHIHQLPVLNDEQRLVGVVTTLDFLGYFRSHLGTPSG